MRVWELRSRQPLRIIAAADKAPVTGLLVLDRPPLLAAGQGRRQGASPSPLAEPRGAASCMLSQNSCMRLAHQLIPVYGSV